MSYHYNSEQKKINMTLIVDGSSSLQLVNWSMFCVTWYVNYTQTTICL